MSTRLQSNPPARAGFTLIELLVVVAIIAVLIAILIPSLSRAKMTAQATACASNARQLAMAANMFKDDHGGLLQPVSDAAYAATLDSAKTQFAYRLSDGALKDWASALVPYLGGDDTVVAGQDIYTFQYQPSKQSKVFLCPGDPSLAASNPGYLLINNVSNYSAYYPISYGVNADICALIDTASSPYYGRFGPFREDAMDVSHGPKAGNGWGLPLNCRYNQIARPSETLLFGDCGTRPAIATDDNNPSSPLNFNDALYYTTNFDEYAGLPPSMSQTTLEAIYNTPWMKDRIPFDRHGGRLSVAFCDGHAETLNKIDFNKVQVSPY